MAIEFSMKQGATFDPTCQYLDDAGQPASLAGVTLTSQIRDGKRFVTTLQIIIINEADGTFKARAPEGTLDWPVGQMYWDVRELKNGVYRSTDTKTFKVELAITKI